MGFKSGGSSMVKQFERMTKGNAIMLCHKLNGVAGNSAGHAMEQSFAWRDNEVGFVVVLMERTTSHPIF
jgi:hypothetical protein